MAMTAFRRSAAIETNKRGKGGGGSWRDRFKVPKNVATPVLFVAGEYLDPNPSPEQSEIDPTTGRPKEVRNAYHKRRKHKHKLPGQQYPVDEECSQGYNPHNPQPCVGCAASDMGNKAVTVGDVFTFTLVHLTGYHSAPVIQNNQILMKKDNSGPVMNYFECEGGTPKMPGRLCNFCRVSQGQPPVLQPGQKWDNYHPQSINHFFGRRRYLEIGSGHLSNLVGFDMNVSSLCGNCRQTLTTDGFSCPHCNSVIIDMQHDPRTDAQIQEAVSKPYPCMHCQKAVILKEDITCDTCVSQGQTGLQLDLFQPIIWMMKQGEQTKSQLVMQNSEMVEELEKSLHQSYRAMIQGKTLRQHIEELAKPYNFDEMFKPKSLQDQAERLKLPMPGQAGMAQGYAPQPQYGQPQYGQPAPQPQFYGAPQPLQQPTMPGYPQPAPQYPPQPQQAPAYAPYPAPNAGPGPAVFQPPNKPNYGQ